MSHGSAGCIIYAWGCAEILPKFLWPVNMSGHLPKIILSPGPNENAQFGTFRLLVRRADHSVTLPSWIECNN